jgi:hypothetical protein
MFDTVDLSWGKDVLANVVTQLIAENLILSCGESLLVAVLVLCETYMSTDFLGRKVILKGIQHAVSLL